MTNSRSKRNLGKDFSNILGASSLECASLLAPFRRRSNSTRTKAAASCRTPKRTVDHSFGCGWAAPCSSVFICGFVHSFGCGSAAPGIRGQQQEDRHEFRELDSPQLLRELTASRIDSHF